MPKSKIKLSIAELIAELRRRQQKLPRLQRLAARLEKQLAAVRAEIVALGGAVSIARSAAAAGRKSSAKSAGASGGLRRRPRNKVSLSETLLSVLDKEKPKSVQTIIADVKAAGYKTTSPNFDTIIYQTIAREKKRIEKVGRGLYKLKA